MRELLLSVLLTTTTPVSDVDFDTDIMPILARAGCNAGSCHGGAAGRGGFKLSLLGGNAALDYEAIVRRHEGRRVNLASPEESLVLLKPTALVDHGGDMRLDPAGPGAELLEAWIRQGARRRRLRELVEFEVTPADHVASRPGQTVRLQATATFTDGSSRDVTRWTTFTSADPAALEVTDPDAGELTVHRRGQAVVVARYLSRVVSVRVTVPIGERDVSIRQEDGANFVDDEINTVLRTLRIEPLLPADDPTFLRRVRLALTGRLPSPQEVAEFLADNESKKRDRMVDRLLESADFTDFWTYRFANLLRIRALPNDEQVASAFQEWVHLQLDRRTPYDEMVRLLLTSSGDSHLRGEAAFYRMTPGPLETAEYVSEIFLGARLRCANCHNHPLDRWTQDDYHGLAAIFARVDRGRVVKLKEIGEVTHPATGKPAIPRLPGDRFLPAQGDARDELASWLTDDKNHLFTTAIVNRLWQAMMGRGLVEPVDDLRATNPATHPRLLARLASDFAQHGYDLRHTLRRMATSAAFQRAGGGQVGQFLDDRYYSRALVRPLGAEVLADAISDVSGVWDRYGDHVLGTRAVTLPHPQVASVGLDLLGRCSREASCDAALGGPGLSTQLHLLNGPLVNRKVSEPTGRLAKLLDSGATNSQIIENFYVCALSRPVRSEEQQFWQEKLSDAVDDQDRRQRLEDFLWSLLTCKEFKTNH